jgi:hypothetical protein
LPRSSSASPAGRQPAARSACSGDLSNTASSCTGTDSPSHLAPWVGQGVYVNMLNFDEQDRVVEALGGPGKHAELARLKGQYDPQNLFRMNYNIPPAR